MEGMYESPRCVYGWQPPNPSMALPTERLLAPRTIMTFM